jgi:D-aminopeptidase
VFAPIGMYETMLRRRDTSFVPNSATPHSINAAGGFDKAYWVEFTGAGGMVSTINDMLRWLAHMDARVVGSRATWELMKTPHRLPNGGSTLYGLGLIRDRYRGVETLHHAGNWVGGNAQMLKVPAAGLDIVVIVNRNDVWSVLLVREVLDACLTGLAPVAKPGTGSAVSGLFRSPSTHRVIHATTRDGQQIISLNGHEMPVAPDEAGVLRPFGLMDYVKQGVRVVGDPQSPTALQLDDYGGTDEFIPVPGEAVSDTRECVGRYRSESTGTQASVAQTPEGLMIQMTGRFGAMVYRLEPLDAGIWRATTARRTPPGVAFVTFERDGTAFRYSTWQTWSLPFRRCT